MILSQTLELVTVNSWFQWTTNDVITLQRASGQPWHVAEYLCWVTQCDYKKS